MNSFTTAVTEGEKECRDGYGSFDAVLLHRYAQNLIKQLINQFTAPSPATHNRNLSDLGLTNTIVPVDPGKVIYDFSGVILSEKIKGFYY